MENEQLLKESEAVVVQLHKRHTLSGTLGAASAIIVLAISYLPSSSTSLPQYAWIIVMLLFCALRLIQGKYYFKSKPKSKEAAFWAKVLYIYSIGFGFTWGLVPYIFKPDSIATSIFLTIYVCGAMSAACTTLTARIGDYLCFASMLVLPTTIYHLQNDLEYSNAIALSIVVYYLMSIFFARNIYLLQKYTKSLLKSNHGLIERLTIEKDNAEKSTIEKTRFIANASHDLRQPLHALGFYLDSLDNDVIKEEDKHQIIKKSKSSLHSLDDLLSSLLDISNIDAGAISVSPVHLRVEQLLTEFYQEISASSASEKIKITLNTDESHVTFCDPILSTRCIRNIVINAIRHANCSQIEISSIEHEDNIEIRIKDNGIGISKENLATIFEEFQQLDNTGKDRQKGLGLGLTIVHGLIELQGHKMKVESRLNEGTTFSILLPLGCDKHISNISYNTKQLKKLNFKKRILVIDDEQMILDSMALLLRSWEQIVEKAISIEEAKKIINSGFQPDIIISDYRLQNKKTGADAINEIKPKLKKQSQIIFISGETEPNKINEIRAIGYPLIHKPVMPINLRSILTRLHQRSLENTKANRI